MRGTESLQLQPAFQFNPHFPAGLRPYWRGSYNLVFYLSLSETAAITPEYASVRYVLRVSLYSPGTEDYDLCNYFTERSRFIKLWRDVNPSMPPAKLVTVNPADLKRLLAEKQEEKPIIFEHLPKECNRRILDYADWEPQDAVNSKQYEKELSKQVGPITALLVPYVPGKQYADDKATVSKLAEMNKAGLAMLDPLKGNLLEIPSKGVVVVDLDFVFRVGDEEDVKEVTRFFTWYNAAYYAYFQEWSDVRVERNYRHTVLRTMLLLHLNGILGSTVTVDSCAGYLWALRTLQVECAREFKWELETPYLFKALLDVNRWLVQNRCVLSQEVLKLRRDALDFRRNALSLFLQPNEFCVWSLAAGVSQIEDLIVVLKDGDLFDHVFQNRACVVALIKAVQRLSAEQCRALPEPDQGPDHERTSSFACV